MGSVHKIDGVLVRKLDSIFDHPDTIWWHNKVKDGAIYANHHGGLLPDNLFWNFLEYRYSLHPHRFTHWHKEVAHLIYRYEHVHTKPVIPVVPMKPTGGVAEPSSLFLLAGFIVAFFLYDFWFNRK